MMQTIFATLLFLSTAGSAWAAESSIAQLKTFLLSNTSLSADFKQINFKSGKETQSSTGRLFLKKPGRFRWNYQAPFVQEIVANAGKVWFYDADLEQVTVKQMDDSIGSTPALLLTGQVDIDEKFILSEQGSDRNMNWVKLSPKNQDSGFKYILIGLNRGQLAGMELTDNFGQWTRIYFSNLKRNPDLSDELFQFIPPPNVDVFEN